LAFNSLGSQRKDFTQLPVEHEEMAAEVGKACRHIPPPVSLNAR